MDGQQDAYLDAVEYEPKPLGGWKWMFFRGSANARLREITAPELLAALRRTEARGAIGTAHRVLQTCGQMFRYAIATGRAIRDPAADLRGALKPVKGRAFRGHNRSESHRPLAPRHA